MTQDNNGTLTLSALGWTHRLNSIRLEEQLQDAATVRVMAVHRDALDVAGPDYSGRIRPPGADWTGLERPTIGDWLALEQPSLKVRFVYPRTSLFKRRAAGTGAETQAIAANVNTLLIVTSANHDFNAARLERYLALAFEAETDPVIIITKADLTDDVAPYLEKARGLHRHVLVEAMDARGTEVEKRLAPWLAAGQTLALMGSSGVGKSTLVNTLSGKAIQDTQGIRDDDAKGRHTTTGRSMHLLRSGAWLMDTPGMRELQIVDAEAGVSAVFDDIAALIEACRFSDCGHKEEPGCAVRGAIEAGALDPARWKRFQKLQREERRNTETVHEAHARVRAFGKMARSAFAHKLKRTREW